MDRMVYKVIFHCLCDGIDNAIEDLDQGGLGISEESRYIEDAELINGILEVLKPEFHKLFLECFTEHREIISMRKDNEGN